MRRLAAIAMLLGCGLDEAGQAGLDAGVEAGDSSIDVVKDVAPFVCADAGPASCTDAVPYRSPALFSLDAGAPCPAGYDTLDLVLATPSAAQCDCTCDDGGAAGCDTTQASFHYGFGNCNTNGSIALSGTCTPSNLPTTLGESVAVDEPKVTGGCTGGTSSPPPATSTNVRLCMPQCASDESMCHAANGLSACVAVVGPVGSCPGNYMKGPFDIGEAPQVGCETCSCNATGDCTGSTFHLYGNSSCGGGDQSLPMDNACHPIMNAQVSFGQGAAVKPVFKGPLGCSMNKGNAHITYGGNEFTVCCQ